MREVVVYLQNNTKRQGYWLLLRWVVLLSALLSQSAVLAAGDYRIGGGDTVNIVVYGQPDLSVERRISQDDETIIYPLLGEVAIGGLTAEAAGQKIARLLKEGGFIKNPEVAVKVEKFSSQTIPVMGQVGKPGEYILEGESRVIDLVAQAGGVKPDAADIIFVVKNENGKSVKHEIDLLQFYAGDMSQNVRVNNGDFILVPKMDAFYIHGEVKRPGSYRLERGMTVMQAVSISGGVSARGSLKGMKVTRQKEDGTPEEIKLELNDKLQPNDVLYVKERLF
jgi:polysaccharide export outer membrane protein